MPTSNDPASYILGNPLFKKVKRQDLARLFPHLEVMEVQTGQILFQINQQADRAFYIIEGEFEIADACKKMVRKDHSFLGEEALLAIDHYTAGAMASRDSRVLVFPQVPAESLLGGDIFFHKKLIHSYAKRFKDEVHLSESPDGKLSAEDGSKASIKNGAGWLLATVLPIILLYCLRNDPALPSEHARYFIAIVASLAVMWMFQLISDFIPALFGVLSAIIFGLAPPEVVLSGFSSDSFFMALSIFGLGAVISSSGLGYRILLALLRVNPVSRWWHNMSVFLVGLFLTPIIPSVNGRIAIVAPFVKELVAADGKETASTEAGRLSVSALCGASLFSSIFLSSKSINFIMHGSLPGQEQARFQWVDWLVAASVSGGVLLVLYLLFFSVIFNSRSCSPLSAHTLKQQVMLLGPFTRTEWVALVGLLVFAGSLATSAIHRIDVPWVAFAIFFALLLFGFVDKDSFRKNIDWAFLFFLGGLIGLVRTMNYIGVDKWLAGKFAWLSSYMTGSFPLFIIMLAAAIFIVRLILPINATVIIFLSLLLPSAVNNGVNPWLVGFLVLFLSESYILPYQASYYMQFCSATGVGWPQSDKRLVPFHLTLIAMKLAAIYISLPFWRYMGLL